MQSLFLVYFSCLRTVPSYYFFIIKGNGFVIGYFALFHGRRSEGDVKGKMGVRKMRQIGELGRWGMRINSHQWSQQFGHTAVYIYIICLLGFAFVSNNTSLVRFSSEWGYNIDIFYDSATTLLYFTDSLLSVGNIRPGMNIISSSMYNTPELVKPTLPISYQKKDSINTFLKPYSHETAVFKLHDLDNIRKLPKVLPIILKSPQIIINSTVKFRC